MMEPREFLDHYKAHFDRACVNSPEYAFGTLHTLLGSLPPVRRLPIHTAGGSFTDPRVHLFYIAPSGSGKGEGLKFADRVAREVSLKLQNTASITDSGLIGSFSINKEAPADADPSERFIYEPGFLHPNEGKDIVVNAEANTLVSQKPTQYKQSILDFYQYCCNAYGTIDNQLVKKTGVGPAIEFYPEVSLYFTSYKPAEFSDIVVERGFFQRTLLIVNEVTSEQRVANRKKRMEYAKMLPLEGFNVIPVKFKSVLAFASNLHSKGGITLAPEAWDALSICLAYYDTYVSSLNYYLRHVLESYISRYENLYLKIASHSALLRFSSTVEPQDISYAHSNLYLILLNTLSFLASNINVPITVSRESSERYSRWKSVYDEVLAIHPNSDGWVRTQRINDLLVAHGILDQFGAIEYTQRLVDKKVCESTSLKGISAIRPLRSLRLSEVI